jgi:hypothetical protein
MKEKKDTYKMRGKIDNITEKRVVLNYIKRRGATLPPVFENVAICMACGKEKHVNASGFCEGCWETFSHLRGGKPRNEGRKL